MSARWLIAGEIAANYLPLLLSFVNGQNISLDSLLVGNTNLKPYALGSGSIDINTVERWDLGNQSIPENSIAVIPLQGVIMDSDTIRLSSYLQNSISNPSINSILLLVNSPGGMVSQIDLVSKQIADSPKPIVTYVMDLNASAAAWLTSGSSKIILSSQLNRIGSIGVMTSFNNIWPALEKFGVDRRSIYASKSVLKNNAHRVLNDPTLTKAEQEKPLIEDLDFVNEVFHKAMIANRKLSADSEVLKGDLFYAERAIELGLADSIDTLENALSLAHQLGLQSKINNFYQ